MTSRRTVLVLGTVAAVLVVTPVMLAAALLGGPGTAAPEAPAAVVARIDALCRLGKWAEVDAFIDYRAKGRLLVPDLWDAAPEADRAALDTLLKGVFKDTWLKVFATDEFKQRTTLTEMAVGPDLALVEQLPPSGGSALRWWLERRGDSWMVIDRTTRTGLIHNEAGGPLRNIRKHIADQLGHPPSLREFVDNAPSWMSRLRVRRFRVDDMLGK